MSRELNCGAEVRDLSPFIGAEISNIKLANVDQAAADEIRNVLINNCVVVFREQYLDPEQQLKLTKMLGPLFEYRASIKHLDGYQHVVQLTNRGKFHVSDGTYRASTEVFHSDSSFLAEPPTIAVLSAQVLPEAGGDTVFANQYAAYDGLSQEMQKVVLMLRAVHTDHDRGAYEGSTEKDTAVHPAVVRHPETGRLALYLDPYSVREIDGMTFEEGTGLLKTLFAAATAPHFCYRHRWRPGDVLIWDNRCALHYAVHDYGTEPRVMNRTSVAGKRPTR